MIDKCMCLLELQGQAADLNLLQEKITTSISDPSQMESEIQSLLIQNEREAYEVEHIFYDLKAVKEKLATLERELHLVTNVHKID